MKICWIFIEGKEAVDVLIQENAEWPAAEMVPDGTYAYIHGSGWAISQRNSRFTGWSRIQDPRFVPPEIRAQALIFATP